VKNGTHTFLPTRRVHFGAASLQKTKEEARSKDRAFVVTGRSLHEKTDLVRRVEALDLPRCLRNVGVPEEDLGAIAREFGDREAEMP
jgi:hypothetical protein